MQLFLKTMNGIANSVDPDQTAVSWSTLHMPFYRTLKHCLSVGMLSDTLFFLLCVEKLTSQSLFESVYFG